jgi:hypothetical protein
MTTFAQMLEEVRPPPVKIPTCEPYSYNQVYEFFMGDSIGFVLRHLEQGMHSKTVKDAMMKRIYSNKILARMRYGIPDSQVKYVREYLEALFQHIFLHNVKSESSWREILATLEELSDNRCNEWMLFCACILVIDPHKTDEKDTTGKNRELTMWIREANLTMFKE